MQREIDIEEEFVKNREMESPDRELLGMLNCLAEKINL